MKRKAALSILVLAFALGAAGCAADIEDYYPLNLGNEWEYKTSYPDGRILMDGDQITRRRENTYFFNNGEIIIRLSRDALINRNGVRILHHPLKAGTNWRDRGIEMKITAVGQKTEVPAGAFDDTVTVVWEATRKGPVTMSADEFTKGPPQPSSEGESRDGPEAKERPDYPLRRFVSTTIFAKGVGPVRYKLEAAEIGRELRTILTSDLVSYRLR